MISYPVIDPVAVEIGPLAVRWYSLAYVAGLIGGAMLAARLVRAPQLWPEGRAPFEPRQAWDLMGWIALGVIAGGRLGYVLFYEPSQYLADPLAVFQLWKGGMSFHGGLAGAVLATWLFSRGQRAGFLSVADVIACGAPIGIFFGRIANFINGELWGRESSAPWAMVFPSSAAGDVARHPSQLYEAALEGLLLLAVLMVIALAFGGLRRPGLVTGVFAFGYGCARIIAEQFREPDSGLGFLVPLGGGGVTMGMLLSVPLVLLGAWLIVRSLRAPAAG